MLQWGKILKGDEMPGKYLSVFFVSMVPLVELAGTYRVQVFDCRGREVACGEQVFTGITPIRVPSGGLIVLTR